MRDKSTQATEFPYIRSSILSAKMIYKYMVNSSTQVSSCRKRAYSLYSGVTGWYLQLLAAFLLRMSIIIALLP